MWKSDGTSAGTALVKNINPGAANAAPSELTNVGGTLFFAANNGSDGKELWKSDGTAAGTVLVKNINIVGMDSNPENLTNVGGTLFFAASNGTDGNELWKSNGTAGGTTLVRDINGGSLDSSPSELTNVNGRLLFAANNGTNGTELWKSNGTAGGTTLVRDIDVGPADSFPAELTNVSGTLFFSTNNDSTGRELWKSNTTAGGTVLVKDIDPGSYSFDYNDPYAPVIENSSSPLELSNVNGVLFFSADSGGRYTTDRELWLSDGTSEGTEVFEINSYGIDPLEREGSNPSSLTNVNGTLFFAARTRRSGVELWRSTGDFSRVELVEDIHPNSSSSPTYLTNVGGTLFFSGRVPTFGIELLKSTIAVVTVPDLHAASDTGTSDTDNFTRDTTPTFTGTADPQAVVQLFDGENLLGTATNTNGNWIFTVTDPLEDGIHTITARVSNASFSVISDPLEVTIDGTPPTVTINQSETQPDPTLTTQIDFTAVFSEPVTGFDAEDVVIDGSAGATTATVTPISSTEYTISVTGMVRPGTVTVTLVAGAAQDVVENASSASTSTDNVVQFGLERLAVGADAGGAPLVEVYDANGVFLFGFFAYDPGFVGGVRVATGDFNGDFVEDIVTATGAGGGPHIRIFDGTNGALITEFFAYDAAFAGGVFVAVGDLDNDGFLDIITGAGAGGGPHVRVFSGGGKGTLADFFAYDPAFLGGVTVAIGDVDNDGFGDIVTGAGGGGSPHVRIFSGGGRGILADFFAYDANFLGGVFVSTGDLDNDGFADILVGAGSGGGPHVRAFSGAGKGILADFFAFDSGFLGGVRVSSTDTEGDGDDAVVVGAGPGGGPNVRIFDNDPFGQIDSFFALDGSFGGGLFVG